MYDKIELLSPIRNFASLKAAIDAKADAIYFGVEKLNMRASANNFFLKDIPKITTYCKKNSVKAYLTLNSILYNKDIPLMKKICQAAKKFSVDAVIASDIAAIQYAHSLGLSVHISTQANISNIEAVKFFSKYADAMILAKELSLKEIADINKQIQTEKIKGPNNKLIKTEIFIHGAICFAISGKCFLSLFQHNKSANRGECLQVCRRRYLVKEEETGKELLIKNKYIFSPKDLSTISFLDEILKTGVSILKIEGRARSTEYIFFVTKAYKDALSSIKNSTYTKEKIAFWEKELKKVYNRGFWKGHYLQEKSWKSSAYGSMATHKKTYIGKISNYFSKIQIAEITLHHKNLQIGDEIFIIGAKTGLIQKKIFSIKNHPKNLITIPIKEKVRKNDEVYLFEKTF